MRSHLGSPSSIACFSNTHKLQDMWPSKCSLFLYYYLTLNMYFSLSERLPEMLREASFTIKEQITGHCPFGKTSKTCRSIKGASLKGDEDFTGDMAKMITNRISTAALAAGHLNDVDGTPIMTESGRLQWIKRFNKEIDINGVTILGTQITALCVWTMYVFCVTFI